MRVLYAENGGVSDDFIDNKLEPTFILGPLHDCDMTVTKNELGGGLSNRVASMLHVAQTLLLLV
jgi:hypothetical protein